MKIERTIMSLLLVAATVGTVWAVAVGDVNTVSMQTSLRPIKLTTATRYGTSVDLSKYTQVKSFFSAGLYTDGTHTITFQKSADNSSFSDCANADFISAATKCILDGTPDQSMIYEFQLKPTARYVRPKIVSGSATNGVLGTAFFLLGGAKNSTAGEYDN